MATQKLLPCAMKMDRRALLGSLTAAGMVGVPGILQLAACDQVSSSGDTPTIEPSTGGGFDSATTDSGLCSGAGTWCVDLSDPDVDAALGMTGGSAYLDIGEDVVIIVNLGDGVFDVVSSICTHQGCTVTYRSSRDDLFCACHNTAFDLDGSVISGPAPRALASYDWELQGTTLLIFT